MALALARQECPLAWVRTTGLSGAAPLKAVWNGKPSILGSGLRSHFSWCQPRPRMGSPGLAFFGRRGDRGSDLVPIAGLGQIQAQLGLSDAGKMEMGVDPARRGHLAAEIDDMGGRADEGGDLLDRAEGFDPVAPDSQGLDFRFGRVERDDAAVGEDQIGRGGFLGAAEGRDGQPAAAKNRQNGANDPKSGHGDTFLPYSVLQ